MRKRIAIFGGSFNPPHFTHQMIIAWLLSTDQADAVWMVPCHEHMFGKDLAPFETRVAMCLAAGSIFPKRQFAVSWIEKILGGKSLTLRTVRELKKRHPDKLFSLVIGLDNWAIRDKWEGFGELQGECRIIVVGAGDQPSLPGIRSTLVRDMIAMGRDFSNFVPAGVSSIIRTNKLYGIPG